VHKNAKNNFRLQLVSQLVGDLCLIFSNITPSLVVFYATVKKGVPSYCSQIPTIYQVPSMVAMAPFFPIEQLRETETNVNDLIKTPCDYDS